jgi:hypothetical protein
VASVPGAVATVPVGVASAPVGVASAREELAAQAARRCARRAAQSSVLTESDMEVAREELADFMILAAGREQCREQRAAERAAANEAQMASSSASSAAAAATPPSEAVRLLELKRKLVAAQLSLRHRVWEEDTEVDNQGGSSGSTDGNAGGFEPDWT